MKGFYLLGILLCCACAPERVVETGPSPRVGAEQRALSDSEYVAACEHRPGARLRLYGCKQRGPQRIPLIIVDGHPLPTDTIGAGRLARERFMAELNGNQIEQIEVITVGDSTCPSSVRCCWSVWRNQNHPTSGIRTISPQTQPDWH